MVAPSFLVRKKKGPGGLFFVYKALVISVLYTLNVRYNNTNTNADMFVLKKHSKIGDFT